MVGKYISMAIRFAVSGKIKQLPPCYFLEVCMYVHEEAHTNMFTAVLCVTAERSPHQHCVGSECTWWNSVHQLRNKPELYLFEMYVYIHLKTKKSKLWKSACFMIAVYIKYEICPMILYIMILYIIYIWNKIHRFTGANQGMNIGLGRFTGNINVIVVFFKLWKQILVLCYILAYLK